MTARIVGLGEALFDVFPDRETLGGAPLNMAVHAHQLGNQGAVASRIGNDPHGDQVAETLRQFGVAVDWLQRDETRSTGTVQVTIQNGEPVYDIVRDVAWDYLTFDQPLAELSQSCQGVCFGTLAQRSPVSRQTIFDFLDAAPHAVRLFDVNLRQAYYDRESLQQSLRRCTAVKLNDDELAVLHDVLSLRGNSSADRCQELMEMHGLAFVAWTRGALGTTIFAADGIHEAAPVQVDTSGGTPVGAGDATAAAVMHGFIHGWPWDRTLQLANHLGAYVATQPGACPTIPTEIQQLLT